MGKGLGYKNEIFSNESRVKTILQEGIAKLPCQPYSDLQGLEICLLDRSRPI
jgi:hypothetical protein